jgi:hypothetical protein
MKPKPTKTEWEKEIRYIVSMIWHTDNDVELTGGHVFERSLAHQMIGELVAKVRQQAIEETLEAIEKMKTKDKFTPGELCFNVDNQQEAYQDYVRNETLKEVIASLRKKGIK